MEYRQLGRSDVRVSAITLGAFAIGGFMWGGTDDSDALAAIQRSIDLGVTSIDTAPVYGFGHSEELIARAIRGRRDKVQILDKYGLRWQDEEGVFHFQMADAAGKMHRIYKNSRPRRVREECEASLRRLGTDHIDVYQCHWRDAQTPLEETMDAVARLIREGKVLAAGVSNFSVEEIEECRKIVPIACDQPAYSMILREAEEDILPYCLRNHVGVVAYSPLQRGLLTGKIRPGRKFAPGDHRGGREMYVRPDVLEQVDRFLGRLRPVAEAHRATLAQLVLNWTVHRPGITAALVGARSAAQAEENAHALDFALTEGETREIDEWVEGLKIDVPPK
jgi:aryl-alcohol dehydrogenase-like predicted oxidoreductase